MKTFMAKPNEIERKWYIVDAKDKTLGRISTEIAMILMGKKKPIYTPHIDTGDYVIVINASSIHLTKDKWQDKKYYSHSQYAGGLKVRTAEELRDKFPERIIEHSIKGMLPKGKLGRAMYKKLFVYSGEEHPHAAQKPELLEL